MEERRKHHHFLTFKHSSFDISSSSDIMRLVPGYKRLIFPRRAPTVGEDVKG